MFKNVMLIAAFAVSGLINAQNVENDSKWNKLLDKMIAKSEHDLGMISDMELDKRTSYANWKVEIKGFVENAASIVYTKRLLNDEFKVVVVSYVNGKRVGLVEN